MNLFDEMKRKEYYNGHFTGDPAKFEKAVSKLLALKDENGNPPSIGDRKVMIKAIIDAYVEQVGDQPSGVQVQRLANWILLEDLTDGRPDKVALTEYPFLTKRQLRTRYRRERADEELPKILTEQKYLKGTRSPVFRQNKQ